MTVNKHLIPTSATKEERIKDGDHPICAEKGHHFFPANYIFARDAQGKAFRGLEHHSAAKFVRYICSVCLEVREVKVCPSLENRQPKPKAEKAAAGA